MSDYNELRKQARAMDPTHRRLLLHAIAQEESLAAVQGSERMYAWNRVMRAAWDAEKL